MIEVKLGTGTAVRIEESYEPNFEAKAFFPDWDPAVVQRHRDWLLPAHYDEASGWLKLSVHSWLLKVGGKNILIDTCVGNHKPLPHRPKWHLMETKYLERLKAAGVERVERFLLSDAVEKLPLHQRLDAVIAEHAMLRAGNRAKDLVHAAQVRKLRRRRIGGVDKVAQFHDEVGLVGLKSLGRFGQLGERVAIVACALGRLVGIVQVGDEADAEARLRNERGGEIGRRAEAEQQCAALDERATAERRRILKHERLRVGMSDDHCT